MFAGRRRQPGGLLRQEFVSEVELFTVRGERRVLTGRLYRT